MVERIQTINYGCIIQLKLDHTLKNSKTKIKMLHQRTTHLNPALAETSPVSNCRGVIRRKGTGEALQSIEDMPELGGRGGEGCKTYSKTFNLHIHE